jgi:hypothetical protein
LLTLRNELVGFFNTNDISARIRRRLQDNPPCIDLIANSLADLSRRGNRFAHHPVVIEDLQNTPRFQLAPDSSFPCPLEVDQILFAANGNPVFPTRRSMTSLQQMDVPLDSATLQQYSLQALDQSWVEQRGKDIVLSKVVGFDVRAFDPGAPIVAASADPNEAVAPGDPDFPIPSAPNQVQAATQQIIQRRIGAGAYVDLNYFQVDLNSYTNRIIPSVFSGPPAFVDANGNGQWDDLNGNGEWDPGEEGLLSGLPPSRAAYDTWTFDYEQDGIDQDGPFTGETVDLSSNGLDDDRDGTIDGANEAKMPLIDEGANGIDDDGVNGVDDPGERETSPPYSAPLRGLQVRIRMMEPATRQVRQVTVVSDFTPE